MKTLSDFNSPVTINPGTTPELALMLGMAQPGAAGTRNSHWLQLRGTAYDTSGHNADWRWFVDVTSNAGVSSLKVQSRIDGASFADRMVLSDTGALTIAGTLIAPGVSVSGDISATGIISASGNGTNSLGGALSVGQTLSVVGVVTLSSVSASSFLKANVNKEVTSVSSIVLSGSDVSGVLGIANGGTNKSSYTTGSIVFYNGSALSENNGKLFWDNTNYRLGLNTLTPTHRFHIRAGGLGEATIRLEMNAAQLYDGNWYIIGDGTYGIAFSNGTNTILNIATDCVEVSPTGGGAEADLRLKALSGTTATKGFLRLPTVAGTPSGAPAGGAGSACYDTSANKLWVYNGSWRGVVLT